MLVEDLGHSLLIKQYYQKSSDPVSLEHEITRVSDRDEESDNLKKREKNLYLFILDCSLSSKLFFLEIQ